MADHHADRQLAVMNSAASGHSSGAYLRGIDDPIKNIGRSRTARFLLLTLLAISMFVPGISFPAQADHSGRNLQIIPEKGSAVAGSVHTLSVTITATASPTVVHFEVDCITKCPTATYSAQSGGLAPFDVTPTSGDQTTTTNTSVPDDTRTTPELACTVPATERSCTVSYSRSNTGEDLVAGWIDHDGNASTDDSDPTEGRISDDYSPAGVPVADPEDPTTDCVPPDPNTDCEGTEAPGQTAEPDSTDVVEVVWTQGPAENLVLSPSSDTNTAGDSHDVSATVTDAEGAPMQDETIVTFTASGTGDEQPSSATRTTVDGVATFTFTSRVTGKSTILAESGNASDTAEKNWTAGPPFMLTLSPPSDSNPTKRPHTVVATVHDQHGNDVSDGTVVLWTASGTGGESPSSGSSSTTDGTARFTFTSSAPGQTRIVARVENTTIQNSATKDWFIPEPTGYWLTASDGGIFAFGQAQFFGSTGNINLNSPIVAMEKTPTSQGYWLVASDGGIFSFGDAQFFGSTGAIKLNRPIVGMASSPTGHGYWLVASDGGIFSFGDAGFHGSTGNINLNSPIVGMAKTPSGNGYWLVAADGGIFSFGDAQFYGSAGATKLNRPIVGMEATPSGQGYWFVATDGGIFAFGDAKFFGSTGDITLNSPIVGMAATPNAEGYWFVGADGGIFSFGDAVFFGSMGSSQLNRPIVGMEGR